MSHFVNAELVANVLKVVAKTGDTVVADDTLVILESMKMEIPVPAEVAGTIVEMSVREGQVVPGVLERRADARHQHAYHVHGGDQPDRSERPAESRRRAFPAEPQLDPGESAEPGEREQGDTLARPDPPRG